MTYEQLDLIADSYIPVLFFITLSFHTRIWVNQGAKKTLLTALPIFIGIIYIYSLMFIDNHLDIWASADLDYSTHTALALVFITTLSFMSSRHCIAATLSMLAYCALMLYQEYHSVADMVTTAAVVMPVLIWVNIKYVIKT